MADSNPLFAAEDVTAVSGLLNLVFLALAVLLVASLLVSATGVDIANLRLSGIFDRSGNIPAGGEGLCFEAAVCGGR